MADAPELKIRMPQDVKDWLLVEAKRNRATLTSEVVRALREKMDRLEGSREKHREAGR